MADPDAAACASSTSCRRARRSPDIVRIVEGLEGTVDDAHRARHPARLRLGRPVGPPARRASRCSPSAALTGCCSARRSSSSRDGHDARRASSPCARATACRSCSPGSRRIRICRRPSTPEQALDDTERFWREWLAGCRYEGEYREAVRTLADRAEGAHLRSRPAASSPRRRRRCRSGSAASATGTTATAGCATRRSRCYALMNAGFTDEARAWRDWLLRAVAGDASKAQILYGVGGQRRIAGVRADWLAGLRRLEPGSHRQRRARAVPARRLRRGDGRAAPGARARPRSRRPCVVAAAHAARLPRRRVGPAGRRASGRCVGRGGTSCTRRCWRGLRSTGPCRRSSASGSRGRSTAGGASARRSTRRSAARASTPSSNSFTQSYGSRELDASTLLIPLLGFLPPDDPRVIGTIDAVQRELIATGSWSATDATARRRRRPDRRRGRLPAVLVLARRRAAACSDRDDEARDAVRAAARLSQRSRPARGGVRPGEKRQLGNFPQAFTHVGLVNSAYNLSHHASPHEQRPYRG